MRVIDDRNIMNTIIDFEDLSVGAYFVGLNTGDLYVKISNSLIGNNAFNFFTDQLATFDGTTKFHPVIAEIHIIKDL